MRVTFHAFRGWFWVLFLSPFSAAQYEVRPVYETSEVPGSNIDSTAVWVAPDPMDSLLFVTEKDLDQVEVWLLATGEPHPTRPFLGEVEDGEGPGEFNRPNGVAVAYHVPYQGGFVDLLFVVDQRNNRVQMLRLPGFDYLGEFGADDLSYAYGIAIWNDGADFYVYITDYVAADDPRPGQVKEYRLVERGGLLGGDFVREFASEDDPGAPDRVESMVVDPYHGLLYVADDEGGRDVRLYDLEGNYLETLWVGIFERDPEGMALYDCGRGRGYVVVSDQITTGGRNQFEVFDRETRGSLGHFKSDDSGPFETTNTDGLSLTQLPVPGFFPNGSMFPVNDDENVHAYDWTDIAASMSLEICPLDRPFPMTGTSGAVGSRLWHQDGSWWGIFGSGDGTWVHRLEDGTFAAQTIVDGIEGVGGDVHSAGDGLDVLLFSRPARFYGFRYEAATRRYVREIGPHLLDTGTARAVAMERDSTGRLWGVFSDGEQVGVIPSEPSDHDTWADDSILLGGGGTAVAAASLGSAVAVVASSKGGASMWCRLHRDGDPPADWQGLESFTPAMGGPVAGVHLSAAPEGVLLAVVRAPSGIAELWTRTEAGVWGRGATFEGIEEPALLQDGVNGMLHIVSKERTARQTRIVGRTASIETLEFDAPRMLIAWPGVDMERPTGPASFAGMSPDIIVVAEGSDGLGHFARIPADGLGDLWPPVTSQHVPGPDEQGVAPDAVLSFRMTDDVSGVDRTSLRLLINGQAVAPTVRGVPRNLLVGAPLDAVPPQGGLVTVRIEARDASNPPREMVPFEYRFALSTLTIFRRGDVDGNDAVALPDAVRLLYFVFGGHPAPECPDAADVNDNGRLTIGDVIYLLCFIFREGADPPSPGLECGPDPTPDMLPCQTECIP